MSHQFFKEGQQQAIQLYQQLLNTSHSTRCIIQKGLPSRVTNSLPYSVLNRASTSLASFKLISTRQFYLAQLCLAVNRSAILKWWYERICVTFDELVKNIPVIVLYVYIIVMWLWVFFPISEKYRYVVLRPDPYEGKCHVMHQFLSLTLYQTQPQAIVQDLIRYSIPPIKDLNETSSTILLAFYQYFILPIYKFYYSLDGYAFFMCTCMAFFVFILTIYSLDSFFILKLLRAKQKTYARAYFHQIQRKGTVNIYWIKLKKFVRQKFYEVVQGKDDGPIQTNN